VIVGAIVLQEAFILAAVQRFDGSWYQGRYLFPVIDPIATVLSVGALGAMPDHLRGRVVVAIVAFLLVVALALPYWVLVPAYSRSSQPALSRAPSAARSCQPVDPAADVRALLLGRAVACVGWLARALTGDLR
jgi:hypothetical protein